MRCGGGAVVKNEADIIEAFVRHNLGYLDFLQVVDNGSTDGTYEILTALVAEGLPLHLSQDSRLDHPQAGVMTAMLHHPAEACDWFFCLDADEFIDCESPTAFRVAVSEFSPDWVQLLSWQYFVPMPDDDGAQVNPVRRIVHRRVAPADPWQAKAVVPARFLGQPELRVRPGNHLLEQANGVTLRARPTEAIRLGHFPIRSAEQVAQKAIIGNWAINARTRRVFGEGRHRAAQKARALAGETISARELAVMARDYGAVEPTDEALDPASQLVRRPLPPAGGPLTLTDAQPPSLTTNVIAFADAHFEGLRTTALDCGDVRVAKTRHGLMAYRVGADEVARHLAEFGEWAAPETEVLLTRVVAGDSVVIVGAGIGVQVLPVARRVGDSGRVLAIESDEDRFRLLTTNVTLNNLPQVVLEQRAVGADGGGIDELGLSALSLLTIADAQPGAVLAGAAGTIARQQPTIYLEDVEPGQLGDVLRWLSAGGYRCWWLANPHFNEDNFYQRPALSEAGGETLRIGLLCLPAGAEAPDGLTVATDEATSRATIWAAQGAQTYRVPARWGRPPLGLDPRWQ